VSELFPVLEKAPARARRALTVPWRALRWFGRGLRRRGRMLLYGLVALVAVHLAATLVTGLMLIREISRQRAAGVLLTKEQLIPRIPAGAENAAPLYQKAFDTLRISTQDEERLFGGSARQWVPAWPAEHPSPEWAASARPVLAANAESLKWARQAAGVAHCAFPVNWEGGPGEQQFSHLARLRSLARMLQLDAAVAAAEGRPDDALADAATTLRMAEHAKAEPALVSQLVAYSIQDIAVRSIRTTLSEGLPSAASARGLIAQLCSIEQVSPSVAGVKSDIAFLGIPVFGMAARGGRGMAEIMSLQGSTDRDLFWQKLLLRGYGTVGRPLLNLDERTYLRVMSDQFRAFTLPWPESQHLAHQLQTRLEARPVYRAPLTRMLIPVFERAIWSRDKATANLGNARIALALALYKSQHGAYPDTLAALEQAGFTLPRDPFGGQPYCYRREGPGYVVYSVGSDMRDDGGVPPVWDTAEHLSDEQRAARNEHYDLPFRVPR
jgi:hypothetical protein